MVKEWRHTGLDPEGMKTWGGGGGGGGGREGGAH